MTTIRPPLAARDATRALGAIGAALACALAATPARAQLAGGQVANDVCHVESNRPTELRTLIQAQLVGVGYEGSDDEKACEKFVKEQVKKCIEIVKNGTKCRKTLDKTELQIQNAQCKEQADKADRKSCKNTAAFDHEQNQSLARTLQVIGTNTCNGSFAASMLLFCDVGFPAP